MLDCNWWNRDKQMLFRQVYSHRIRNVSRDSLGRSNLDRWMWQSPVAGILPNRVERRLEASFVGEKVAQRVLVMEVGQRTLRARICEDMYSSRAYFW